MNESFLHYIWQFQYFDKKDLRTSSGETILVLHPGHKNIHSGPDFHNAKVRIGPIEWVGSVEIHLQSSGWQDHRHHEDDSYENVILHVVWEEDQKIYRKDQSRLPTLELRPRVMSSFILQYKRIVQSRTRIPCAQAIARVPAVVRISMLDKALMSRLERKSRAITESLQRNNCDWEETCYQTIARNFGFKVNPDPFLQLALSVPYKILMKHGDRLEQVEALLFGQAGFLNETINDEYYSLLRREYLVLSRKFDLGSKKMNRAQWRFLRLRPANFPSIRLAQFASVIFHNRNLFSRLIQVSSWKELLPMFSVETSPYWRNHYRFFKKQAKPVPGIGKAAIENIVINSVVPMLVASGRARDDQQMVDRAVRILQETEAEENNITDSWKELGLSNCSAFDSQSLIELFNNFCLRRRCLDCSIGSFLLQPGNR